MKEKLIRTNFYFPRQMLDRLKLASEKTGLCMSELIRKAVDALLKELGC